MHFDITLARDVGRTVIFNLGQMHKPGDQAEGVWLKINYNGVGVVSLGILGIL